MKTLHKFIFEPGQWIGEGKITFSISPEHLRFYTRWLIEKSEDGTIRCQQEVEMEGREENVFNHFVLSQMTEGSFVMELTSSLMGTVKGKGVYGPKTIAWEFRGYPDFEGFEVYELQDNGDYMLHAEYMTTEQFKTIVDGRIWKK